jgi:glyoxylase-like metal-dependent hydrolase (beta-lactamase superfamily II)
MQTKCGAVTFALAAFSAGCASSSPTAGATSAAPTSTATPALRWEVLTAKRPGLTRDLPPGEEELAWVANSSTLIYGERDAVLVDTFLTTEQMETLVAWVARSGKNLTTIYITHAHGDHFFGLAPLLERFPNAKAVATPEVVKAMQDYLSSGRVESFRKLFPGQIPDRLPSAEPLEGGEFVLEGQKLVVVNDGKTDTEPSTSLYIPSIGLLVAGDAVYNGIHPYFNETDTQSRIEWMSALDRLEALKPKVVIAGHKVPGNDDAPSNIGATRQYIQDFNRLDEATTSARQLYDSMMKLYPDRANPGSLWNAANLAKKLPRAP